MQEGMGQILQEGKRADALHSYVQWSLVVADMYFAPSPELQVVSSMAQHRHHNLYHIQLIGLIEERHRYIEMIFLSPYCEQCVENRAGFHQDEVGTVGLWTRCPGTTTSLVLRLPSW